jgi:hypothetical protein
MEKQQQLSRLVTQVVLGSFASTTSTIEHVGNIPFQGDPLVATEQEIVDAIENERTRCVNLLDRYRHEFEGSIFLSLWCRIRNQIAAGIQPEEADFQKQFEDEDFIED